MSWTGAGDTVDVAYGGTSYPVLVQAPPGAAARRPLLVVLHASWSNPAAQLDLSGLRTVADAVGFALAAPAGDLELPPLPGLDPRGSLAWNVPGVPTTAGALPPPGARDDVAFLLRVADAVVERLGTDPDRVVLTGFSGGGRMACAVACRHAQRVAGIAPVAGLRAGRAEPGDPTRPDPREPRPAVGVPVVAFHGRRDEVNPFGGSDDPRWGYPVPLAARTWAEWNACRSEPDVTRSTPAVTRTRWDGRAPVELWTLADGGHTWPGSRVPLPGFGPVSRELDAAAVIGEFVDTCGR